MTFFRPGKSLTFFRRERAQRAEHDLRLHVATTIEEKGSWVIYRRARRDENGLPILATSTKENRSSEALVGANSSLKYLFDDHMVKLYISKGQTFHEFGSVEKQGDTRTDVVKFFGAHDCVSHLSQNNYEMPDEHDKLIVPVYDLEGELFSPLRVKELYDIASCEPYRLDNSGRVEFFELNTMTKNTNSHRL